MMAGLHDRNHQGFVRFGQRLEWTNRAQQLLDGLFQ